ncbi:MAG: TrkA C-terminal domain-containing protein [Kiritimatiellae bacterium]|nr:TrkA C-terminal domain-containing protein [Kiritimatiellia bacterium]
MNLILFVVALIASFIVVRIGAIAFQLTGLEWSLAKFQALSCFSGTGFTTREAELIVGHPKRRKIASILMVLGNAGLVMLIATFANSIRPRIAGASSWFGWLWRGFGPLVNLLVIAGTIYLTWRFFAKSPKAKVLTDYLRSKVKKSGIVEPVSVEELMVSSGGYGVVRTEIANDSPLAGRTLAESAFRQKDITILVVRRGDEPTANPPADTKIQSGDRLLCFGKLDKMREEFGGLEAETPAGG